MDGTESPRWPPHATRLHPTCHVAVRVFVHYLLHYLHHSRTHSLTHLLTRYLIMESVRVRATSAQVKAALPNLLANLPHEWRGTTFKNSNLLGRSTFAANLNDLILQKGGAITADDLVAIGNAEDYLRVSSNVSSLLEFTLAVEHDYDISQVFTFASTKMPYLALMLTAGKPVHVYLAPGEEEPFTAAQLVRLAELGCYLQTHHGSPVADPTVIVVSSQPVNSDTFSIVDAIVQPNILLINNLDHINSAAILTHRKRMSTPITTPAGLRVLQKLAGIKYPLEDTLRASDECIDDFYAHLQEMSGTDRNPAQYPVAFTAGLSAIASMYLSLIAQGGVDVLMASTSYGGSSELTDILTKRTGKFRKTTFDITGKNDISTAISNGLDALASDVSKLQPITLLFVEIPTNPDMKIPDLKALATMIMEYGRKTGKEVFLAVDATFAPGSQVMRKLSSFEPELATMVFISLSKSVSRGLTTGGTIVAGPTARSAELLEVIRETSIMLDTHARPDQLYFLARNHAGVEERCGNAYTVARTVGDALRAAVKTHCGGYDMELNFVTPEHAASGFTSSTYSFNLPPYPNGTQADNEALAQDFTTLLEANPEFKPCVSFGQDNGLVYATVPATSTQGAIKLEDKAKQAVGGVQLCRLSFPPSCDVEKLCQIVSESVATCYAAKK